MRIILKILKWFFLALGLLILSLVIWFLAVAVDHPPGVTDRSALEAERLEINDTTFILGTNWLRKSESGLWEMYIEGAPFERGVAFGKLTKELLYFQESAFFGQIRELVPSRGYLRFLKYFLAWFNRNLDKNIPEEYRLEIYGTSFSCSPEFDFIGSGYQRQLNYHAAHDIGHALRELNMAGCTSFSVWDGKSADSTLIVARNFDFFAGNKFAENKIVCFFNPSEGHKFMMISWADMIGAVSGMNEKGLTVTINASRSTIPGQAATPVSLVAREMLQYASTIDEAYEIATKRRMFVSESFMIGSASDGRTAIIEKSPDKYDIVYPDGNQIVCANHFQGEAFSEDKGNIENIAGSDSKYRFDRMTELLDRDSSVSIEDAISILRNKSGIGDTYIGLGNQLSINQLIAHHAVVFKPGERTCWVSAAPYQLGKFIAYNMDTVFSLSPGRIKENHEIYLPGLTMAADTFLLSVDFHNYKRYLKMTAELKIFSAESAPLPPLFAETYILTNPMLWSVWSDLGDYFYNTKDFGRAAEYFREALAREVAGRDIREELTEKLKKSEKKSKNATK